MDHTHHNTSTTKAKLLKENKLTLEFQNGAYRFGNTGSANEGRQSRILEPTIAFHAWRTKQERSPTSGRNSPREKNAGSKSSASCSAVDVSHTRPSSPLKNTKAASSQTKRFPITWTPNGSFVKLKRLPRDVQVLCERCPNNVSMKTKWYPSKAQHKSKWDPTPQQMKSQRVSCDYEAHVVTTRQAYEHKT